MAEFDTSQLMQPMEVKRPMGLDIFNSLGLYSEAGLPFLAQDPEEYDLAGGLKLQLYARGDSPSRDEADLPFNATWFEHLRENYADSLRLLEGLRQDYATELTPDGVIDGPGIIDLYYMGVDLSFFLLWRGDSPIKNGEVPAPMSVLRQALLGIGTVLLHVPPETVATLTGKDIANMAEANGDLVGDRVFPAMPQMVCPASPEMIANLGDALLVGNQKRGTSPLLEQYGVDIKKLKHFSAFVRKHGQMEKLLMDGFEAIVEAEPAPRLPVLSLKKPKTKLEQFDELVNQYATFMNEEHPGLYESLDRTDQPPKVSARRLYKKRTDLLQARIAVMSSDDPRNITSEVLDDLTSLMP